MNGDANNKKGENMRCFSQVCQKMYTPTNKTTKFKTQGIIWTTIKLCLNIRTYPQSTIIQPISTQVWNCDEIGLIQMKIIMRSSRITSFSR